MFDKPAEEHACRAKGTREAVHGARPANFGQITSIHALDQSSVRQAGSRASGKYDLPMQAWPICCEQLEDFLDAVRRTAKAHAFVRLDERALDQARLFSHCAEDRVVIGGGEAPQLCISALNAQAIARSHSRVTVELRQLFAGGGLFQILDDLKLKAGCVPQALENGA